MSFKFTYMHICTGRIIDVVAGYTRGMRSIILFFMVHFKC
jgi:hypothetical protein